MATPNSLVGATLAGRYRLNKLIGQGGMGAVYAASDRQMADRLVAVKVLAPHLVRDATQVTRFEQEARAANQLRHPNTISVLDFGHTEDGHVFMALEYLEGETLSQVLTAGALDPARALHILRQVCKSLAEAHAKGIIHRDLKPDNIFVCEVYGEQDFVKVIDFGIAKLAVGGADLTQAGKMFGTPRYLSPEQAQGHPLTAPSDLYSTGVILFEMLTGNPPFVADDSLSIAIKHVQERPPTLAEAMPDRSFPPGLERLVGRLLEKKASQRFQSAEEVLIAVDACMDALGQPMRASGHYTPLAARTPARPSTVPPMTDARATVRAQTDPATGHPVLAPEDTTRALGAMGDATQMLDLTGAALATQGTAELEATAALPAMPDAPDPAIGARVAAPADAPARTPSAPAPVQREGKTLTLDVEESADGSVAPRPSRPPRTRAKSSTAEPAQRASTQAARVAPRHDGPNLPVLFAIALVLAGLGGGLAWVLVPHEVPEVTGSPAPGGPTPTPSPAALPPTAPAPEPAPALQPAPSTAPPAVATAPHVVVLESQPSGASVVLDGMPAGPTPLTLKLRPSSQRLVAVLTLEGYEPFRLDIDPDKVIGAGLAKLPIALVAKPKPIPKVLPKKPKIEW